MEKLPIVAGITCTRGRHALLERALGCMLKQDYKGKFYYIIFNNSPVEQKLAEGLDTENIKVILINQSKYSKTGEPYNNTFQFFSDAVSYVPEEVELLSFPDDDDIYLPNHITEGARGYLQALENGKIGYKPYHSFIEVNGKDRKLMSNVCEPSIFVQKEHIQKTGFSSHSSGFHLQWITGLTDKGLLHDPKDGVPTWVYQWGDAGTGRMVYHMSGNGDHPENLKRFMQHHQDEGDGIITPNYNGI